MNLSALALATLALAVGIIIGFVLAMFRPNLLVTLGLQASKGGVPVFDDGKGRPAVNPADPDLPDAVDATERAKISRIPHKELRDLVQVLGEWKPKRHQQEKGFQLSFRTHLLNHGYSASSINRHRHLQWTAEDRAPDSGDKHAIPDFSVKTVLVEIKRDITASAESDRALGQMARYCIAWRQKGPALLIVCNEFDDNLRKFIERTVRGWKAQGVPVMAYFVRGATVESGDDEFPVDAFK